MQKETIIIDTISLKEDTLFGEINQVINYLNSIKFRYKNGESIYLNQEWSGYEDNYFEIIVERQETDEECLAREEEAKREKRRGERRKEAEECKRKKAIQQKIDELKEQL